MMLTCYAVIRACYSLIGLRLVYHGALEKSTDFYIFYISVKKEIYSVE